MPVVKKDTEKKTTKKKVEETKPKKTAKKTSIKKAEEPKKKNSAKAEKKTGTKKSEAKKTAIKKTTTKKTTKKATKKVENEILENAKNDVENDVKEAVKRLQKEQAEEVPVVEAEVVEEAKEEPIVKEAKVDNSLREENKKKFQFYLFTCLFGTMILLCGVCLGTALSKDVAEKELNVIKNEEKTFTENLNGNTVLTFEYPNSWYIDDNNTFYELDNDKLTEVAVIYSTPDVEKELWEEFAEQLTNDYGAEVLENINGFMVENSLAEGSTSYLIYDEGNLVLHELFFADATEDIRSKIINSLQFIQISEEVE